MIEIPNGLLDLYYSDATVKHCFDRGRYNDIPLEQCLVACIQQLVNERNSFQDKFLIEITRSPLPYKV